MNTKVIKSQMVLHDETNETLANYLKQSVPTISKKINGKLPFTSTDISLLARKWNLTDEQVVNIFINKEVRE
jgi:hypothetical protein